MLSKAGWKKKTEEGKTLYKVLVLPAGGKPVEMKIVWERPEGVKIEEYWMLKKDITLEWLQTQVGGNIETLPAYDVDLKDGSLVAIFHEEGGPECQGEKAVRNYLVGEWMESDSASYYGQVLILPACVA